MSHLVAAVLSSSSLLLTACLPGLLPGSSSSSSSSSSSGSSGSSGSSSSDDRPQDAATVATPAGEVASTSVATLAAANNRAELAAICAGRVTPRDGDTAASACDGVTVVEQRARLVDGALGCEELGAAIDSGAVRDELWGKLAHRAASCGAFDLLFERVLHVESTPPMATVFAEIEAGGVDLYAAFTSYAKAHPAGAFFGTVSEGAIGYASGHLAAWLQASHAGESATTCKVMLANVKDATPAEAARIGNVFFTQRCTGFAPMATAMLADADRYVVRAGCEFLGEYGNKKDHEQKVRAAALGSDGGTFDACEDALRRIRTR